MAKEIDETVERTYMKLLTFDAEKVQEIKDANTDKGAEIIEKIFTQDYNVLKEASKAYRNFVALKEESQDNVLKLDIILDQVMDLKAPTQGRGEVRTGGQTSLDGDYLATTYGEFDKKSHELDAQIKKCEEKIETQKQLKATNAEKIKDTKEYLQKFVVEKRLYLDKVDEIPLREKSK